MLHGGSAMFSGDGAMAWRLADDVADALPETDRAAIYMQLGCGDISSAITRMLSAVVRDQLVLPTALLAQFGDWLDSYRGNVDEPPIRELLERVHNVREEASRGR